MLISQIYIRRMYIILALTSLGSGVMLYILFRNSNLMVWTILPEPVFWDIYKISWNETNLFFSAFVNSGPDCLWLLSGIFVLSSMWLFERKTQTVYISLFYLVATSYNMGNTLA